VPSLSAKERRSAQRRALLVNSGMVTLSIATGGLTADLLQIYAYQVLRLHADEIGIALGLLVLSNPVELASIRLVRAIGKRRLMQLGYAVAGIGLIPFALLPEIPTAHQRLVYPLFIVTLLVMETAIASSWGVAWHPWMQELTRPEERGRFLGRMRFTTQAFNIVVTLLFGLFVGATVTAHDYDVLLSGLAVYLGVALWQVSLIPEAPLQTSMGRVEDSRLRDIIRETRSLLSSRPLRPLLVIFTLDVLALTPLTATYAVADLKYPAGSLALIIATRSAVVTLSMLFWGRTIDRIGSLRVMQWTMASLGGLNLLWLFVTPVVAASPNVRQITTLSVLMIGSGLLSSGFAIASLATWYGATKGRSAVTVFTVRDVVGSTKLQLFFLVSGLALSSLAPLVIWRSQLVYLDGYKGFILGSSAIAAAIAWLVARLRIPAAYPGAG
jgi:Sugar (and other) transporter